MAVLALTDAFCYVHGYDFTGDTNSLQLQTESAQLDATTFGSGGWNAVAGGLKSSTLDIGGFWQAGTSSVDVEAFPDLATANRVHTMGDVETAGQVCYFWQAGRFTYSPFSGSIGDLAGFSLGSTGTDGVGVVRGALVKARSVQSAGGQVGSTLTLAAAPTATQYAYGSFHVFSTTGDIRVMLQSDTLADFSTATTRYLSPVLSTPTAVWVTRIAGPMVGHVYWRWAVNAITGDSSVAGAIGIQ
jgi:hypothetical protein